MIREKGGGGDRRYGKAVQENVATVYFSPADMAVELSRRHRLVFSSPRPRVMVVQNTTDFNARGDLLEVDCLEQPT